MKRPKRLDFTPDEIVALMARIENQQLEVDDFSLLADVVQAMVWMDSLLKEKTLSIARLRAIFGIKTESVRKLVRLLQQTSPDANEKSSEENSKDGTAVDAISSEEGSEKIDKSETPQETPKKKEPKKGHGHRPSSDYREAKLIQVAHEALKRVASVLIAGRESYSIYPPVLS